MGRIVFWIVLVFAVLFLVRLANAAQAKKRRGSDARAAPAGVPMVKCSSCGVYLPRADARAEGTGFRCAEACATRR